MVKIVDESTSSVDSKDESHEKSEFREMPKLISCTELERRDVPLKLKLSTGDISLKKLDPAVLDFHSRKNSLTRYGMEELMNLKDTRHAQSPPSCLFDPNLLRLGIFTDHPSPYQTYRQQLQNITMPKFDSNLLKLLNSIKGPSIPYGLESGSLKNMPKMGTTRRVSWKEEDEKTPPYNKSAFFDNITSTTTFNRRRMSPDCAPRVNNNGNTFFNNPSRSYPTNNNKARKHLNPLFQESTGLPEEDKKNLEDSLGKNGGRFARDSRDGDEELQDEPEWFSAPVSRLDTIELRGFDDDSPEKSGEKRQVENAPKEKEFSFDDFLTQHGGPKPSDRRAFFPNRARQNDCFDPYFGRNSPGFPQDNIRAPANSSNSSSASSPKQSQHQMLNSLHGQQKDFNMNEKNIYKILNSLKKQQEMQQMQRPMNFEQFMDRFPQNQRNMHMPGMPGGPGQGFHYQQPQQHRQGNGYSAIWDKFRQEHNVPPPNNNEFRNGRFFGGNFHIPQQQYHQNNMMPTPEQLMMHTQSIMQNALMRKANQNNQNSQNNNEKRFQKF